MLCGQVGSYCGVLYAIQNHEGRATVYAERLGRSSLLCLSPALKSAKLRVERIWEGEPNKETNGSDMVRQAFNDTLLGPSMARIFPAFRRKAYSGRPSRC